MRIHILLFATLKDRVGGGRLTVEHDAPTLTVEGLRRLLAARYPEAEASFRAAIAAVNEEYAAANDPVNDGDTVAFFPPVSGGDSEADPERPEIYQLAEQPIDHDALIAAITTPATGAVCLFSGFVRGQTDKAGHLPRTAHLEYEAYAPMALAKMRQVAAEIRARWPLVQGIAIVQRVGVLSVGQNTIVIACSSGHRDQGCFEGARYGIDRLKEIVPVWKKEVSDDGAVWIEGDYQPTSADRERRR